MSEQPQDAATKPSKLRAERTSINVSQEILDELKLAWHEECAKTRKDIPQQEFTDGVLRKYLDSRKQAL